MNEISFHRKTNSDDCEMIFNPNTQRWEGGKVDMSGFEDEEDEEDNFDDNSEEEKEDEEKEEDVVEINNNNNNFKITQFLALDKCLPKRHFIEFIDIESETDSTSDGLVFYLLILKIKVIIKKEYDPEWLAITKTTHHLLSTRYDCVNMPTEFKYPSDQLIEEMKNKFWNKDKNNCEISIDKYIFIDKSYRVGNPQTDYLLSQLDLQHTVF